jgi:hypothetical protein
MIINILLIDSRAYFQHLSASYFREAPLPVTFPLAMGALSLGFGFNLGFLHWSGNWLAILEVSLLSLPFLKPVVTSTINT